MGCDASFAIFEDSATWAFTAGLPSLLYKTMQGRQEGRHSVRPLKVFLSPSDDRFYLETASGLRWDVDAEFTQAVEDSASAVEFVALGAPGSWYVQFADGTARWSGLSDAHSRILKRKKCVSFVSLGARDEMFVRFGGGSWESFDLYGELFARLKQLSRAGRDIRQVLFNTMSDEWLIRYS